MSYRLYPDIIISAQIIDSFRKCCEILIIPPKSALNKTFISVDSCMRMQKMTKNMGWENIFTGSETKKNWDKEDYVNFFKAHPQYFEKEDSFYRVKFENLIPNFETIKETDNIKEIIRKSLKDHLLENSYGDRLLQALNLSKKD